MAIKLNSNICRNVNQAGSRSVDCPLLVRYEPVIWASSLVRKRILINLFRLKSSQIEIIYKKQKCTLKEHEFHLDFKNGMRKENYRFGRKLKQACLFESLEKGFSLMLICKVKKLHRPWGNVSGSRRHASACFNQLYSRVLLVFLTTFTAWYVSNAHNIAERHFSAFYWLFLFCKTLKREVFPHYPVDVMMLYIVTSQTLFTLWYHQ